MPRAPVASSSPSRNISGLVQHEPLPFGPSLSIHRYTIEANGLSLLVLPDPSAPVVSYQTWFKVGSRHEEKHKTGLSHLLEHLMFLGTERHPEGDFDRLLEKAGAENNAATWTDWTQYYENLPISELPLAIELESDRMRGIAVSPARFLSERDVVISERRDRVDDDVESAASELLYRTAFGLRHPYGWPTIGWRKDLNGITRKDALGYYKKHYAPNHATLVVAGEVEPRDVARRVLRAYRQIPAMRRPEAPRPPAPVIGSEVQKTLRFSTPTEKVLCGWHAPRYALRDHAVLFVALQVLCGGRSSRLYRKLVRELELVQDVRMSATPFELGSLADLWLSAREGKSIEKALRLTEGEIRKLAKEGPSARELEKVKNRVELGFLGGMETASGKAEQVGLGATVTGDPAHAFVRLEELRGVTREDVQRVVRAVLVQPNRARIDVVPREKKPKATARAGGRS